MAETQQDCLTERHLAMFGRIIHWFARYETVIDRVIAELAGSDVACMAVLTRNHGFAAKRLALLDLMRLRELPSDRWERVHAYLAVPDGQASLRDAIAHSTWIAAPGPHSIQPNWVLRQASAVEPMNQRPGATGAVTYSLDDLGQIVGALADNCARLTSYLQEEGLLPK